jgi:hypothetical protein
MGFSFRKSVNIGPFRVSASRSGIGYSVGGRGFRVGKNARGRKYHSFSIPGTGVSYRGSLWVIANDSRDGGAVGWNVDCERDEMMQWKRTLRTASSERFLLLRDGKEAAAVDLHYLDTGTVSGTVILLKSAGWSEEEIPTLLKSLDEDFLPDVDLERGTLAYTVIVGEIVGVFEAELDADDPTMP